MQAWQQGYDLLMLKALSSAIKKDYKKYVFGAFGMPNERDIATALAKGQVIKTKENDSILIHQHYQAKSRVTDFTQNAIPIEAGTFFVKHLAGPQKRKLLEYYCTELKGKPLMIEIFDEDSEMVEMVQEMGFSYITTKISASSDLKGIYQRDAKVRYQLASGEAIHIKQINSKYLSEVDLKNIRMELANYTSWADHYSSYNKRQSWSAFALRGYDVQDPNFIIKPNEMSKKWKAENEAMLSKKSDWTNIADRFPFTCKLVREKFAGAKPDRVRFMRLTKGNGELSRHADITDREAGIQAGRVVRLHIPIFTNPDVIFQSWSHKGQKQVANMQEGSLWYLDVRKPHTAVNHGDEDRIHLVMDFYSSEDLTNAIISA
jgi:hypothetical protein